MTQATIEAALDDHRWTVIEYQLESMLPTISAEQPEAILKKLDKKRNETLLEFVNRFMVTASTFSDDQLSTSRKAKLLFQKLPRELQKQLAILNFEECTTKKLASRVKNYLDWMSVGDQKAWKDHLADYMDIDTVNMANENEDKQDPQINNFGNNERVVLPRKSHQLEQSQ